MRIFSICFFFLYFLYLQISYNWKMCVRALREKFSRWTVMIPFIMNRCRLFRLLSFILWRTIYQYSMYLSLCLLHFTLSLKLRNSFQEHLFLFSPPAMPNITKPQKIFCFAKFRKHLVCTNRAECIWHALFSEHKPCSLPPDSIDHVFVARQ